MKPDGQRVVKGQTCDSFVIRGFTKNHLLQRANDSQPCELDNSDHDFMQFVPSTYSTSVDPSIFKLPLAQNCSKYCGRVSDCFMG